MRKLTTNVCAICGEERSPEENRFLLAENRWEDKLTILQWNEGMASRQGIQVACSVNHVEELVIQWMTTGSLDYPFARAALGAPGSRSTPGPDGRIDLSGGRQLGELGVHRESMERVLAESPQSLKVILDALLDALRRELPSQPAAVETREQQDEQEELCSVSSEPER
jgi:hypothetical protein